MSSAQDTLIANADSFAAAQKSFTEKLDRLTQGQEQVNTAVPELSLRRYAAPRVPASYMLEQSICLIAQGKKRVVLGENEYVYDANHFLLTSVDLPVVAQVLEASREKPYLGVMLKLDQREIAQMMVNSNLPAPRPQEPGRAIVVSEISLPLLNVFHRLLDLLDEPESIPFLAPHVQQEIIYRLLVGDQGPRLRQMATSGSRSHQIGQAIEWLKNNFEKPLRVAELAAQVGMSTSRFHHHFRELTAMSPLVFQKRVRLNEARQLMLTQFLDASDAAFQVGYESPSQFSREYSRLFGTPPSRDIRRLLATEKS